MEAALRHLVQQRAENRCEYCRLHQTRAPYLTFHVDHMTPRSTEEMTTSLTSRSLVIIAIGTKGQTLQVLILLVGISPHFSILARTPGRYILNFVEQQL